MVSHSNLTRAQPSYCSNSDLVIMQYNNILTYHGQELQQDTSLKLAHVAQAIAVFYLPLNLVLVRTVVFFKPLSLNCDIYFRTNLWVLDISHSSAVHWSGMERQSMWRKIMVRVSKSAARYGSRALRLSCLLLALCVGLGSGIGGSRRSQV